MKKYFWVLFISMLPLVEIRGGQHDPRTLQFPLCPQGAGVGEG